MQSITQEPSTPSVTFRPPTKADGAAVHKLIDACKPLDLNSTYTYLLLCTHFAQTCVLAELDGEIVGFVSAYRKPEDETVLFVWQVAVGAAARGRGVAKRMLSEALERPSCEGVRYIETTIGPSNRASWALFESFAAQRGAACKRESIFQAEDFGEQEHEEEVLLRIGPFNAVEDADKTS